MSAPLRGGRDRHLRRDSLSPSFARSFVLALALLAANAGAAPVDIFLEPETHTLYLRADPGVAVGSLSLVVDGATGFTPAPTANISAADSLFDASLAILILVAPPGGALVPSATTGLGTAVGTLDFPSGQGTIREDLDLLGPAVLDVAGLPIESWIVVRDDVPGAPEPPASTLGGLVLAALALSRLAARRAASARPCRWLRAA